MYLQLTPTAAVCTAWHPCWPRPGLRLLRIRHSRTFPISHPSTRLSLELLSLACRERHFQTLLDVGCGSGVLALAGAILGIPGNVGCDLSAAAIRVSRENARRYDLDSQVFWLQGSTEALRPPFQLVVANVPFQVQAAKKAELTRLADPQGGIILSGFRDTGEQELTAYYLTRGWRLKHRLIKERWEVELPAEKSYTWVGLYFIR